METILLAVIGIICIALGISNRKGNISSLHSYHRNRVTEEDRIPFGKMVGNGMIIIGVSMLLYAGLSLVARLLEKEVFVFIGMGVMLAGLGIGLGIAFRGMIKYNKGIF